MKKLIILSVMAVFACVSAVQAGEECDKAKTCADKAKTCADKELSKCGQSGCCAKKVVRSKAPEKGASGLLAKR